MKEGFFMRSVKLLAILFSVTCVFGFGTAGAQPANDDCANAEIIGDGSFPYDGTGATLDGPIDADANMAGDFWFLYTATCDGLANIGTCAQTGTSDDTVIIVYPGAGGCPPAAGTFLASADDSCGASAFMSEIPNLPVIAGESYLIQVGGWNGPTGTGTLDVSCFVPGVEICDDGIDNDADGFIDCFDADCVGNPSCFEGDDLTCSDGVDNDGDGTIDCADIDCFGVGVCGTEICDDLIDNDGDGLIDCADTVDCPFGVPPCLAAANDECDGAFVVGPAAGFGIYTAFIDSTLASDSAYPLPTIPCDVMGSFSNDVWFNFTPDADGAITVHTCDPAGYDTDLAVYEGFDCTALTEVGCNGDSGLLTGCQIYYSHISGIAVTGGNTYWIRNGSWAAGASGTGTLTVDFFSISAEICDDGIDNDGDGLIDCADEIDCPFGTPPCDAASNDECDGAIAIDVSAGAGVYTQFMDSTLASDSAYPLPTIPCNVMGAFSNDVWFQFTPSVDAVADIHTCDPAGWDTDLAIYEGVDCTSLTEVGCDGDSGVLVGCQGFYSHVQFVPVTAGNTYWVRCGSWAAGATGTGNLTIEMVIPAVEDCTNGVDDDLDGAIDCLDPDCFADPNCVIADGDECITAIPVFDGANPIDTSTYTTSTLAPDYGLCPGTLGGNMDTDGWYSWTATADADYWIHTCDPTGFDSDLIIYEGDCSALTPVACNGDDNLGLVTGCQAFFSFVEFTAFAGTTYTIRIGNWGAGGAPGTLNIVPLLCPPMAGLSTSSDCVTGDVTVSWTGNAYDQIEILRDTVLIDTVDGADTSYVDPGLAAGVYNYTVQGVCAGNVGGGQTAAANVASYGGEPDVIFALEGIDDIDSVTALQAALDANGILYVTTTLGPAEWGCLGSSGIQRAWMMTGTYPNDYRISAEDGIAMTTAVQAGTAIYMEAGDHWGFAHLVTPYDGYDGVDQGAVVDGDDSFVAMNGADSGFGLDTSDLSGTAYNQANAGNDWTDQILPLPGAGGPNVAQIWSDAAAGYGTGIFYSTDDPTGNTISQSWEFGGFGGDQTDLAARYIAALGGGGTPVGDEFMRGDCNADSGFNIADCIFTLAALFSGGPSGTCLDACDSNDDGSINIADGIYSLAALFSGGAPPPAPGPTVCGVDPTDTDPLDCAAFAPCP